MSYKHLLHIYIYKFIELVNFNVKAIVFMG